MSNVSQWNTADASNTSAPPDGAPEGMLGPTYNDVMRAMMGALARWYADTDGSLVTAGTGNAYTLTTNNTHAALADQSLLIFKVDRANTDDATLAVDGLGAKSWLKNHDQQLAPGDVEGNQIVVVGYNATDDVYELLSPALAELVLKSAAAGAGAEPAVTLYRDSASPAANDLLGQLKFRGKDSGAADQLYALLHAQILDPTAGAEDGQFVLQAMLAGTMTTILTVGANGVVHSRAQKLAQGTAVGDADIAAGILTLAGDGNTYAFSGTEALTGIATVGVGTIIRLVHTSARTLTHEATDLILPGGANITTAAGDVSEWYEYAAADWRCTNYQKADGTPVATGVDTQQLASGWVIFNGTGTVAIQDHFNVTSVTDNGTGDYTVTWDTDFTAAEYPVSICCENPSTTTAFFGSVINGGQAAGTINVATAATTTAAQTDVPRVHIHAFGDQ